VITRIVVASFVFALCASGADAPSAASVLDRQLGSMEKEVVSLAEAMPADKYNFAPKEGAFTKVRTFGEQVRHIATVNYEISAAVLGEKMPVALGENENGSADLKTKDQIVAYLKDSFAYTHKAMQSATSENLMQEVQNAFAQNKKVPRLQMITIPAWHTFDHYGQMVVYARMNGIVPPASR
jgi:hypothetical protein